MVKVKPNGATVLNQDRNSMAILRHKQLGGNIELMCMA
jgi:hypothetical protein